MSNFNTQLINNVLRRRWLSHVIFWLLLLVFYTITLKIQYGSYYKTLIHHLIMLIPEILASYCLVYWQIPKLLYRKKYFLFLLSVLLGCYLFTGLARTLVVHIIEELYRLPPFGQESLGEIFTDIIRLYDYYFYNVFIPVLLFVTVKFSKTAIEARLIRREILAKEKISAELNFFKAQIHPHFLFNTLNNLYVLTLQKSDKASETVLKLSEMLDYMLYQCNDNRVTIDKELKLIQNYIHLEQLRYGDRLELNFNKTIDNSQTQIAPLILISLIENAFKHGASGAIKKPIIKIDVKVEKDHLYFSVFNTKTKVKQDDNTNFKKGIGLSNTKSQLQLLYPNKHELEIIEEDLSYQVKLHVDLGNNTLSKA